VHGALLATWDLAGHPVRTVVLLALGVAVVAWAALRLERAPSVSPLALLAVAVLLRALLLPLPPTLSDDVLRYVWDGRALAAGFDPYRLAPEASELEPLRDELWERLPHRQVPTVYPPLALAVFAIASRSPAPILTLKLLLSLADSVGCALLVWLAARLGLPMARAVWYAWNPLVVLEVAGMGHIEGLGVVACLATVALLADRPARHVAAGVAAAAAILAKLVPFVAFPAWVRESPKPFAFAGVALALVAVACAPFLLSGGIPQGHVTFGISWEFNGPFWEPLWRVLDRLGASPAVEGVLDSLKQRWGHADLWNRLYPYNYPQLLAKAALAIPLVLLLPLIWRRQDPVLATGAAFAALLLCSATVYPWYLLWILPWAALARQPAWLLLSATLPLAYLPQFTDLPLMPWIFLGIWTPFFLALLRWPRWSIA
jgi:Glycosyltransferase family 87